MTISTESIKALRENTGVSVMECKKALEEAGGDMDQAIAILKKRSFVIAQKKSDRALGAGTVAAYVHSTSQVGSMVLLSCETDFVAKNEAFVALARDIAMQVAALRPENVEDLLAGSFIKDSSKTIADLLSEATQKFGERVEVSELSCLSTGK